MIFSPSLLLLLFFFFFIFTNANEQYHLGVINHHIQWQIYCPENNTRIINSPFNDQPLISYQCPYGSLPIDIVPVEVDFTFICRSESRLIWIIVDVYQYNDWFRSKHIEQMNISVRLNEQISINDSKNEVNNYKNRLIMINAFYIPFESLEILLDRKIEIFIRMNQCQFDLKENSTWREIVQEKCQATQSRTLHVQSARCQFYPKLLPIETSSIVPVDNIEDTSTNIPDFHVVLSIDEQQRIETTTMARPPDYYVLFNEHYRNILSTLAILIRTSNLITYIFIFTIIIFILVIIFFIYTLCYHYHTRSRRKSSLLI